MHRLGIAFLLIFLSFAGCLSNGDEATAPEVPAPALAPEVPAVPAPPAFEWAPANPNAGDTVLLQVPQEAATQVVWLVAGQRYEGRTVQVTLPEGTHDVSVRFVVDGETQTHERQIVVAAATPLVEEPATEEAPAPGTAKPLGKPVIVGGQDQDRVAFSLDWEATPARVDWFFGDGATSNELEPVHTYGQTGSFQVRAVAWLGGARHEPSPLSVVVDDVPLTFTVQRDGDTVSFRANWDQPDAAYEWSFGDGTVGSGRFAEHTYQAAGPFRVELQASAGGEVDVSTQDVFLDDYPLTGLFEVDANIVRFSTEWGFEEVAYAWYFGDGLHSSDAEPEHRYPAVGTYTVTVQVRSGPYLSAISWDVEITEMKIGISAALDLNNLTADAVWDLVADNYTWYLGAGPDRYGPHLEHDYDAVGEYLLVLTGRSGPYVERVALPLTVWTLPPVVTVTVPPGNVATFAYTWTHVPDVIRWDYGDQDRAFGLHNPTHVYEDGIGTYPATLTVTHPDLRAVGIPEVQVHFDVDIEFDGIPQFECDGEPVYEPTLHAGQAEALAWAALRDGRRVAVVVEGPALEVYRGDTVLHEAADGVNVLVLDQVAIGEDICFRVPGGDWHALEARNAMTAHDGTAYTVNMMVHVTEALPMEEAQAVLDATAGRVRDATDGHVQLGHILLVRGWAEQDKPASHPATAGAQNEASPCPEGTVVKGTFAQGNATTCPVPGGYFVTSAGGPAGASFASGKINSMSSFFVTEIDGTSENPSSPDAQEPPSILNTFVHEFGHWGLGPGDKYGVVPFNIPPARLPAYSCVDAAHDISMFSSSSATEMDSPDTPCPDTEWAVAGVPMGPLGFGPGPPAERTSWEEMQSFYPLVPDRVGPPLPGPTEAGDAYWRSSFEMGFGA